MNLYAFNKGESKRVKWAFEEKSAPFNSRAKPNDQQSHISIWSFIPTIKARFFLHIVKLKFLYLEKWIREVT